MVEYSDKYNDDKYYYRVILVQLKIPTANLTIPSFYSEKEWRDDMGICMSRGWINIYNFVSEEDMLTLMFKKPYGCDNVTGLVKNDLKEKEIKVVEKSQPWLFTKN